MWREVLRFVRARLRGYDGSHDVRHALSVARNADIICADEGAREACLLAALLHDVCDSKYVDDPSAAEQDVFRFLAPHVGDDEARVVSGAARWVSFSRLRRLGPPPLRDERALYVWTVVSDADMLEAMGATGVLRTLMYQGHMRRPIDDALSYAARDLVTCIEYITHDAAMAEARLRLASMRRAIAGMVRAAPLRPVAHYCVARGRDRTSFDETIRLLSAKRHFSGDHAHLRYELARERAWHGTARAPTIACASVPALARAWGGSTGGSEARAANP